MLADSTMCVQNYFIPFSQKEWIPYRFEGCLIHNLAISNATFYPSEQVHSFHKQPLCYLLQRSKSCDCHAGQGSIQRNLFKGEKGDPKSPDRSHGASDTCTVLATPLTLLNQEKLLFSACPLELGSDHARPPGLNGEIKQERDSRFRETGALSNIRNNKNYH